MRRLQYHFDVVSFGKELQSREVDA